MIALILMLLVVVNGVWATWNFKRQPTDENGYMMMAGILNLCAYSALTYFNSGLLYFAAAFVINCAMLVHLFKARKKSKASGE